MVHLVGWLIRLVIVCQIVGGVLSSLSSLVIRCLKGREWTDSSGPTDLSLLGGLDEPLGVCVRREMTHFG